MTKITTTSHMIKKQNIWGKFSRW